MKDDMMQMIKEKLLNELIDKMSDSDSRLKPSKGLGVSVEAPDKEHLAEGLEHAQDLIDDAPEEGEHSSDDDEERMLQMLADDDDDKDGEKY